MKGPLSGHTQACHSPLPAFAWSSSANIMEKCMGRCWPKCIPTKRCVGEAFLGQILEPLGVNNPTSLCVTLHLTSLPVEASVHLHGLLAAAEHQAQLHSTTIPQLWGTIWNQISHVVLDSLRLFLSFSAEYVGASQIQDARHITEARQYRLSRVSAADQVQLYHAWDVDRACRGCFRFLAKLSAAAERC